MSDFLDILKSDAKRVDVEIEKLIPRSFSPSASDRHDPAGPDDPSNPAGWLNEVFGNTRWAYDVKACEDAVAKPIWNLLERGGKRWRPFLMRLCYEAVGGKGNISKFLPIVEVIHNGTLMVDDIEDGSDLRRGKDCVHKIYGEDIAINAGNAMYYLPMLSVSNSDLDAETKVRIYEVVNEEMIKLHFGQGMDIFWHGGGGIPDENEYLQMCAFKTGTLARMAAKLGGILGEASDDVVNALGEFAESLGVAFQIQDDILNICPGEDWGKDFGDDITEGKRTLILIKALENVEEDVAQDLIDMLNLKTRDRVVIGKVIDMLRNSGAVEYASGVAKDLVRDAWEKLDRVLMESEAKAKLKMFSDFVVERDL